jgi:hypothetical protein
LTDLGMAVASQNVSVVAHILFRFLADLLRLIALSVRRGRSLPMDRGFRGGWLRPPMVAPLAWPFQNDTALHARIGARFA